MSRHTLPLTQLSKHKIDIAPTNCAVAVGRTQGEDAYGRRHRDARRRRRDTLRRRRRRKGRSSEPPAQHARRVAAIPARRRARGERGTYHQHPVECERGNAI